MAATNVIRAYLKEVIGLGDDDQGTNRANAMIAEGLDSFESMMDFSKEDIKSLCSSIRKPGGLVVDPNDADRQVQNPGLSIPAIAESRLITCAYGANIYKRIGREATAVTLSKTRLAEFKTHRETVKDHDDPDGLPPISKTYGIMKLLEHFLTYLESRLGMNSIALAYMIQENATPALPLPGLAHGKPWSLGHNSIAKELIDYASHDGPAFQTDNATVYRLLQEVLAGTQHMSSIKPFQRQRNGRGAYEALQLHNMGNSKWEKVVEAAETWVGSRTWDGRNARYALKSHIARHREAHNDFIRASQYIAYAVPNDTTRVQRLLRSIQCKDGTILSAKTTILADVVKKNDFEQAADFLLLVAPSSVSQSRSHNISALKRKNENKSDPKVRYYSKQEWLKLSSADRSEITSKRRLVSKLKKSRNAEQESKIAALETALAEQKQVIVSFTTNDSAPTLPPKSILKNPLQPPTGFTS